jgi:molybdopterin converting factor small subunit
MVVKGQTLGAVIDGLEAAYPGVKERLLRGQRLDPSLNAVVDGRAALLGLNEPVAEGSEIHFVPAIAGG